MAETEVVKPATAYKPSTEGNRCKVCGKPLTKGEVGDTCRSHEGKLRSHARESATIPEGWVRMSIVCKKAVEVGIPISAVVNAAGGDAATKPVLDRVFEVVYVGRAKYMNPKVMTDGFKMLRALREKPAPAPAPEPENG